MGLTGLAIFKLLPKTNCKECGVPTCMAFAMALAAGKATLDQCPYVSDEAKEALESATAPPIKLVKAGSGDKVLEMGDEQVIFRHDKTFYHPTGIFIEVADDSNVEAKVEEINGIVFERVGQRYEIDGVAIVNASGNADTFKNAVAAAAAKTGKVLLLVSEDPAAIEAAAAGVAERKPILYAANGDNYEKMVEIAKKINAPLVVKGKDLSDLADLVGKIVGLGYKELILDSGERETSKVLADLTQIRRQAIKKRFRPFGYPTIAFTTEEDPYLEALQAQVYVSKYASVVVMKTTELASLLTLFSWRDNIYTDPQKPIAVQPGVYAIGDVTPDSPVYITTNFSLTFYTVQTEIEATKLPSYLIAFDTEGLSVLTAWAGGKFIGENIGPWLKDSDLNQKVSHKKLIIPGGVAAIKGKIEELSGWEVIVGPREANGIGTFAKLKLGA
ncbi:corrinoid/iron-sulfur protein large subunit AcsC [Thermacetogenium phaeum DSM 12270]|uniref:Corrinoid/iron-sulfur protein large subunit AcsC n=1 Tax=Thermacetogenium phaeum (strain ATCC BAA-254 / DSM 26808 / PB) TaxID=1089553 RepID=K4LFS6_THEPS|nr:acetyl-CoA decarbonylase/synthase complex subunit gamma [Thermacetogenium phaeum]AFV11723.1 corrinoid/iron-sulfur protein large subunit AcsC [Thermacetogenium phaeum DSM 12270]